MLIVTAVDKYFGSLDVSARAAFERVRGLAMDVVPEADQGTSYGLAALTYRRKPLLGFRAAQQHVSIFPFSPEVVEAVQDRLSTFELSKGTIRFTADKSLPDDVVREVVRLRAEEIAGPS